MTANNNRILRKEGFTLIELLIVIAILGTLAVVVLLALNPLQQLARTRDAGRQSAVTQLGHAIEAYATTRNGVYPTPNATWITTLVNAGEIQVAPSTITFSVTTGNFGGNCTTNVQSGICYTSGAAGAAPAVVFASLESQAQNSRCAAGTVAWAVYSTAGGRGGIACSAGQPTSAFDPATFLP
ncbi:MAG: type II secretion system protein [Candidatus Woesebacteria bacterium]|nr:MAG: type II secretion system protein [Candidatus Woesebacteria bacterium]